MRPENNGSGAEGKWKLDRLRKNPPFAKCNKRKGWAPLHGLSVFILDELLFGLAAYDRSVSDMVVEDDISSALTDDY